MALLINGAYKSLEAEEKTLLERLTNVQAALAALRPLVEQFDVQDEPEREVRQETAVPEKARRTLVPKTFKARKYGPRKTPRAKYAKRLPENELMGKSALINMIHEYMIKSNNSPRRFVEIADGMEANGYHLNSPDHNSKANLVGVTLRKQENKRFRREPPDSITWVAIPEDEQ
jgi:hypothetical protein